jgi:DNA primase
MQPLQNKPRHIDLRQAFLQGGDSGDHYQNDTKELIRQANTVDLIEIFQAYQVNVSAYNKKCNCPFPHHNDDDPSFYYYSNNNSWYCFGCSSGGKAVEFVSLMDQSDKETAARKIHTSFETGQIDIQDIASLGEKYSLVLKFSEHIRDFLSKYSNDDALKYAEKITLVYDTINTKHNLDNNGIKILIEKLITNLGKFGTK